MSNPNQGIPLSLWPVREHVAIGVMPLSLLIMLVPNPEMAENPAMAKLDPTVKEHADMRKQVQRVIKGSGKASNIPAYADYIAAGLRKDYGDGWSTPPVVLWTPRRLDVHQTTELAEAVVPFDTKFTAIDAETQVAALHRIYANPAEYDLTEDVRNIRIAFELYWGLPTLDARQIFHDRNLYGVQVPKALALSMDKRDIATQIAEKVITTTSVEVNGKTEPLSKFVNRAKRQLGTKDPEWVTLSSVRSLAVTTLFGPRGIERTSGVIDPKKLPAGYEEDELIREAVDMLKSLFRTFTDEFAARSAITAPAVLAGLGAVANCAMSWSEEKVNREDVIELISDVRWEREAEYWQGVAAKPTAGGKLSFAGGVKDSAYRVHDALLERNSENGRKIRGRKV